MSIVCGESFFGFQFLANFYLSLNKIHFAGILPFDDADDVKAIFSFDDVAQLADWQTEQRGINFLQHQRTDTGPIVLPAITCTLTL